jgi:hypothetical protein
MARGRGEAQRRGDRRDDPVRHLATERAGALGVRAVEHASAARVEPFRQHVTLSPESTLRVDASLTRIVTTRPLHANPLFWTAIACGVAMITTSVLLAAVVSGQAPKFNTTKGSTIQAPSGDLRF